MVSFRSYDWEGKGLKYYIKDIIRNKPPVFFTLFMYLTSIPLGLYYLWLTDDERSLEFSRFRTKYIVYRDDDPRVKNVLKFDDDGNRIYYEPRMN